MFQLSLLSVTVCIWQIIRITDEITRCLLFHSLNNTFKHVKILNYIFVNLYLISVSIVEHSELRLPKISRLHMGDYLCVASNGIPPSTSKKYRIRVQCKFSYNTSKCICWCCKNVQISVIKKKNYFLSCHTTVWHFLSLQNIFQFYKKGLYLLHLRLGIYYLSSLFCFRLILQQYYR